MARSSLASFPPTIPQAPPSRCKWRSSISISTTSEASDAQSRAWMQPQTRPSWGLQLKPLYSLADLGRFEEDRRRALTASGPLAVAPAEKEMPAARLGAWAGKAALCRWRGPSRLGRFARIERARGYEPGGACANKAEPVGRGVGRDASEDAGMGRAVVPKRQQRRLDLKRLESWRLSLRAQEDGLGFVRHTLNNRFDFPAIGLAPKQEKRQPPKLCQE